MSSATLPPQTGVSQDYAGIPNPNQPVTKDGQVATTAWWRFFLTLTGRQPEVPITLGASPTTFTAPAKCQVLVTGGGVAQLAVKRNNSYTLPYAQGFVPMAPGDELTITYSGSCNATYFPM